MKISGFTFIRNGNKLAYPFIPAIQSILPVCDELIVVVGDSEDDTLATIKALNEPKIKIVESVWDEGLRENGQILAQQTNLALSHCSGDWGFYIQGDEVFHQQYHAPLVDSMKKYHANQEVEGLLFDYLHFYGSYNYVGASRNWYRAEIRAIKLGRGIQSWGDAQGFRRQGEKLKVKHASACMYHYGWVRPPQVIQEKRLSMDRLYHDDEWLDQNVVAKPFEYNLLEDLKPFEGTHPAVMQSFVDAMQWDFNYDPSKKKSSLKNRVSGWIEKRTGLRIGEYKNYILLK